MLFGTLLLGLMLLSLMAWRLSVGPVDLGFLTGRLEAALNTEGARSMKPIMRSSVPLGLYPFGASCWNFSGMCAIIGTRKPELYGKRLLRDLQCELGDIGDYGQCLLDQPNNDAHPTLSLR